MTNAQKFYALLQKFYQKSNQSFDELDHEIYIGGIAPIGVDRALDALMTIARSKGLSRIPSVGDILEAAGIRSPDPEDEANAIMGRIIKAVRDLGGYRPEEAQAFIGEIGWEAVRRTFGSWDQICMIEESDMGIIRAQLRDMVKAVQSMASVGRLDERTALPKYVDDVLKIALTGISDLSEKRS